MTDFKWTGTNEAKVFAHGLSPAEVEEAFENRTRTVARRDRSHVTDGLTRSGRPVRVVWWYDLYDTSGDPPVFVITAY